MPTLPPDRAIEARFIWPGRKLSKICRSLSRLRAFRQMVDAALRRRLIPYNVHQVLIEMSEMVGPTGCCPGMKTLAERAGCSLRTVQRAIARAEALGLLRRRRRPRVRRTIGSRVWVHRQTNAYELMCPRCLPDLLPRQRRKQGKACKGEVSADNLAHSSAPVAVAALGGGSGTLAALVAARQAARDAAWLAARGYGGGGA